VEAGTNSEWSVECTVEERRHSAQDSLVSTKFLGMGFNYAIVRPTEGAVRWVDKMD